MIKMKYFLNWLVLYWITKTKLLTQYYIKAYVQHSQRQQRQRERAPIADTHADGRCCQRHDAQGQHAEGLALDHIDPSRHQTRPRSVHRFRHLSASHGRRSPAVLPVTRCRNASEARRCEVTHAGHELARLIATHGIAISNPTLTA